MELRTLNYFISKKVMGDRGKVVIVKIGVDSGLVHMYGIRHTSTSISKHTNVGVYGLLLMKICFRVGVPGGGEHCL